MRGYVYQSFCFDNKIKDHFSTGANFLEYQPEMDLDEQFTLAFGIRKSNDFMPDLKRIIEEILEEKNCVYDFWEFGPDGFSLFWSIKKEVYLEKMKKISEWAQYEEIDDLVHFQIHVTTRD